MDFNGLRLILEAPRPCETSSFVYVFLRVSGEFHAFIRALTGSEGGHATQKVPDFPRSTGTLNATLAPPGLRERPLVGILINCWRHAAR